MAEPLPDAVDSINSGGIISELKRRPHASPQKSFDHEKVNTCI
jgi:hypothetical protein